MADSSTTSATSAGWPRTRQRVYKQPPTLDVPHIEEDAAERKRVLNVLAQRRYREKKRLSRLKGNPANRGQVQEDIESALKTQEPSPSSSSSSETAQVEDTVDAVVTSDGYISALVPSPGLMAGIDMGLPLLDPLLDISLTPLLAQSSNPDGSKEENVVSQQDMSMDTSLIDDFMSTINPSSLSDSSITISEAGRFDSYNLPILELTLLKALMRIASRLGFHGNSWDLECLSPFNLGTGTPVELLPETWRPTNSQITVPHHPMLDFLPWPTVRDRIINIMTLPDEMRPLNAKGPLALVNFAYDVEDSAEGVRIFGEDPYEAGSWEVGQVLFERWWFLFDRDIIANSNRWRRMRGAPPLRLKGEEVSCGSSQTTA